METIHLDDREMRQTAEKATQTVFSEQSGAIRASNEDDEEGPRRNAPRHPISMHDFNYTWEPNTMILAHFKGKPSVANDY